MKHPLLSICINTRNRADFLAQTLDSMIRQMVPGVEIVVLDGASEDGTPALMKRLSSEHSFIKYVRSDRLLGIDDGYDAAVEQASGDYCWLMTDDDLIFPGALRELLSRIDRGHDLLVLNLACFSKDLSRDLNQRLFNLPQDKIYSRKDLDAFFSELGVGLSYIGCVVIKRSLWAEKPRDVFFGTYFVHMGVICGSSMLNSILFLHKPLIQYRSGNSSWTPRSFLIWYFKWPDLVWSFTDIPAEVRNKIVAREPWRRTLTVLKSRAMGEYNYKIFNEHMKTETSPWRRLLLRAIAGLPAGMLNMLLLMGCLVFRRAQLYTLYNLMISSPRPALSQRVMRVFGVNLPLKN